MFGRNKKKSQPPEVKPKPKVTRESFPTTKTPTDMQHRKSAPDIAVKGETTIDSNTTPLIKQPTVDEDEYLVPSRAEVGSDEYLKVEIEKQNSNETKAKSEEEVLVNASFPSDVHHLHIHIHIPPSQTEDIGTKQWKVIVGRSNKNFKEDEAPKLPPRPASAIFPPSPAPPPRSYKNRDSVSKTEEEKQKESSNSSEDESEVDIKTTDRQVSDDRESYEDINYGASAEKDNANEVSPSSEASQKEEASPQKPETQNREDHHPWLFQQTESARVEKLLKTDKDGRFAVIQEDEDSMPFTPYTLLVVQNRQLKKIPVMKKETAGKAKYSLANAADKKSIDDLVTYFQSHEKRGLKLKLKLPE